MKRLLLLLCGGIFLAHSLKAQCSFTINVNTQNPFCFGQPSGMATASVSGATGPISIHWLAPINVTGPVASGLVAGTYQVAVIDSSTMCDDTVSFSLIDPMPLQSAASPTMVSCNGGCNGMIVTTVFGGTAPYAYNWSNGATTSVLTGLCPGVYFFTATDANGCTTQQTVTITQPAPITFNTSTTPVTCGMCDGTMAIVATGGTGAFQYSSNNGLTFQPSPTFSNLCGGNIFAAVIDANGCLANNIVTIPSSSGFSVGFDTIQAASCGNCNGVIVAVPSGGVTPYSYSWTGGVSFSLDSMASGICSYNTAFVNVTDNSGCVVGASFVPVTTTIPGLTVTHSITPESMPGGGNGSIDITVTGTSAPLSFDWSNGASTEDIFSLSNGTYTLLISDTSGNCNSFTYTLNAGIPQYGTITGSVYNDINMNCTYDTGESGIYYGTVVANPGNFIGYVNWGGNYTIWAPLGSYTVTHTPGIGSAPSPGCITSHSVNLTVGSPSAANINFADTAASSVDAYVWVSCNGIVPGFNGTYYIGLHNFLPNNANGTLQFILPDTLTYVSSSVTPSAIAGDTLWFNVTNITQGNYQYITVVFSTPANPALLSTILTACADLDITNFTDVNPNNNYICYQRMVTGSFDPNDKSVSPVGEDVTGDIELTEDTFTYLIRFQNTGNGPAVNIHVDDTISNLLDMSTFEMLGASHSFNIVTKPGNVIVWEFDNINLPDSGSNEPASHGWIQFKIKAKSTVAIGDVINNTADIYFDFNPPVITNTTVNTYVVPDYIPEIENGNSLKVYPNPVNDILTIVHPENGKGAMNVKLMDISGRVVQQYSLTGMQATIDVNHLAPGLYVVEASNNNVNYTTRFVRR